MIPPQLAITRCPLHSRRGCSQTRQVFDRAYVKSHHIFTDPIDVGALAEVCLFYGSTELVLERGGLTQLLKLYGADAVIEFVSQGYVNARYLQTQVGIHTEVRGGHEHHSPIGFRIDLDVEADVIQVFRRATDRSGYGRRRATAFLDAISVIDLGNGWIGELQESFKDETLLRAAVSTTARHALGPSKPGVAVEVTGLKFDDGGFTFDLDAGWKQLSAEYLRTRGEPLNKAALLSTLATSLTDLHLASRLGADISTGELGSELLRLKCRELEAATVERLAGISSFQTHVLNGRDIRTAVNQGERDLNDVMTLLDHAGKFREWIRDQPFETNLVHQYIKEATANTWASNVPLKMIRFLITTFAGAALGGPVGAGIGMTLGAADVLVMDRVLEGWRPNQFVEGSLDPFVGA